ncbi:MAG: hypothetical protein LBO06_04815 [Bacteroidales bacterium]|jgi:hypothetical protein|nr:hypothetical protein [Bacteroidales bacterium]
MNWKEQLLEIESRFGQHKTQDWTPAIQLVINLIETHPHDVEVFIRVIYLLHNILVEEYYSTEEHDEIAYLLKKNFDKSYILFSEDAEYLFFIGKILHIAEWYFGSDNCRLAIEMQKKAMDKEPKNLLYEWAYRLSCENDNVAYFLAHQIIENEKEKIDWLKGKGFPGNYILENLQTSNKVYLANR